MRQNIRQALRLMREHRLYSTIYIAGTAVAVLMAMLVAFYLHLHRGHIYPEHERRRTLYMDQISLEWGDEENRSMSMGSLSLSFIQDYLLPLEGVERVSTEALLWGAEVSSPETPKPRPMSVRHVDQEHWRIFDYEFISGEPFSEADVSAARRVAVVSRRVADYLFAGEEAMGRDFFLDDKAYRIVGIVRDVPYVLPNSFGHIWVPHTCSMKEEPREGAPTVLGGYQAKLLMKGGYTPEQIRTALSHRLEDYTKATGQQVRLDGAPYTTLDKMLAGGGDTSRTLAILIAVVALFLIVPALNLSGLNSTILEGRLAEIGVRKAFGATRLDLMMQFIVENFLLSFIGASIGFVLALFVASSLELIYIYDAVPGVDLADLGDLASGLSPSLLLDGWTMLYLIVGAFIINLISSLLPVLQFSRQGIVSSLLDHHANQK